MNIISPYPRWDAQLDNVVRRFPSAVIHKEKINAKHYHASFSLLIPDYKLGSLYNKENTELIIPLPDYFPIMESWDRYFNWKPFSVFTDKDLRLYYGGSVNNTDLHYYKVHDKEMLRWHGALHMWNPARDGLYNFLMVVHHVLQRQRTIHQPEN